MRQSVNQSAWIVFEEIWEESTRLGCLPLQMGCGTRVIDAGIDATSGFAAGLKMAELSMAGLAQVAVIQGAINGIPWPNVQVHSEFPHLACFLCQSASWPIETSRGQIMGSGPACLLGASANLPDFGYKETSNCAVFVLEGSFLPDDEACQAIAAACHVTPERLGIMAAPTGSMTGVVQIAARSVEIAMHKLHRLGFDLTHVSSGLGCCPIAPPGGTDFEALGKTNDAMMFASQIWLSVLVEDQALESLVEKIPASSSKDYGKPFLKVLEAAGGFYGVDPDIFAPAEITIVNQKSGRVYHAGQRDETRLVAALLMT
ncbi:MAG: methenyltetrahydromethanopterin cyclohydrolase [Anaerolineales bacterium]|nr:methenyltetrahydromethanopterin cyclohydrolase [Anaerolineales bacterium]